MFMSCNPPRVVTIGTVAQVLVLVSVVKCLFVNTALCSLTKQLVRTTWFDLSRHFFPFFRIIHKQSLRYI